MHGSDEIDYSILCSGKCGKRRSIEPLRFYGAKAERQTMGCDKGSAQNSIQPLLRHRNRDARRPTGQGPTGTIKVQLTGTDY
jgi:hypothetical protein